MIRNKVSGVEYRFDELIGSDAIFWCQVRLRQLDPALPIFKGLVYVSSGASEV